MRLPQTYTGSGQQVVGPFTAGDAVRIVATNKATSGGNFAVKVLGSDGSDQDIPINEIGDYNGSTISNNLSGSPYYLTVDSDGSWTITLSSP